MPELVVATCAVAMLNLDAHLGEASENLRA